MDWGFLLYFCIIYMVYNRKEPKEENTMQNAIETTAVETHSAPVSPLFTTPEPTTMDHVIAIAGIASPAVYIGGKVRRMYKKRVLKVAVKRVRRTPVK